MYGSILQAVKSLYNNSQLCVKSQGRTGQSVPSQTGLKQGCPLSPTLFGLFADGLHRFLAAHCPGIGPVLSDGRRVPKLGYADDFVLLAESPQALQVLIDATAQFCAATGMLISVDKTKVLVFSQAWPGPFQWVCNGQPLEWVAQSQYLGLVFQAKQGMHATYSQLHLKMWGAWALLQRQYGQLHCASSVGLLLQVCKACVPPTALYGSEIWGLYRLRAPVPVLVMHLDIHISRFSSRLLVFAPQLLHLFSKRNWRLCHLRMTAGIMLFVSRMSLLHYQ